LEPRVRGGVELAELEAGQVLEEPSLSFEATF